MNKISTVFYRLLFATVLYAIAPSSTQAQWSEVGANQTKPQFDGWISSIATNASGKLYVGGFFQNYNSVQNAAQWNSTDWSWLGGANVTIFKNAYSQIISCVTTDASGNVYAAGSKYDASFIAKWNGSIWGTLGVGVSTFNNYTRALTIDAKGNVYAAGQFTNGNGKYYVAKWDGSSWSELGGTNSAVFGNYGDGIKALTTDASGNVYAAGSFINSKGNQYVAKWDGRSWSEVGGTNTSTFDYAINALTKDASGNLYAAGDFKNGIRNYYVAKWDGSSWSELGGTNKSDFNSGFLTLTTDASGNVYGAGRFSYYSYNRSNYFQYVVKWDGSTWSELGGKDSSTFNDKIETLTIDSLGNVYAAGDFKNSNYNYYVAKYTNPPVLTPITLNSFTANTTVQQTVQVNWQSTNEINAACFELERSINGKKFTSIGKVTAAGNSTEVKAYSFTDNTPFPGISYYRLKMIDKDGSFSYSSIVKIGATNEKGFTIFPNPVEAELHLQVSRTKAESVTVKILDQLGKVLKQQQVQLNVGNNSFTITVDNLAKGSYMVVVNGETLLQKQFIKY